MRLCSAEARCHSWLLLSFRLNLGHIVSLRQVCVLLGWQHSCCYSKEQHWQDRLFRQPNCLQAWMKMPLSDVLRGCKGQTVKSWSKAQTIPFCCDWTLVTSLSGADRVVQPRTSDARQARFHQRCYAALTGAILLRVKNYILNVMVIYVLFSCSVASRRAMMEGNCIYWKTYLFSTFYCHQAWLNFSWKLILDKRNNIMVSWQ